MAKRLRLWKKTTPAEAAPAKEAVAEEAPAEEADDEELPEEDDPWEAFEARLFQYGHIPPTAPHGDCRTMQWWHRFLRSWTGGIPPRALYPTSQMLR